jgi:hypothetical protein
MNRYRTALTISLAAALVCVLPAAAKRAPSSAEKKAIASAVTGYVQQPGSPAAKDNRIVTVAVSTLDRRYAAVRLMSKSAGPSDMVFHLSVGTWWVVGFGSSLGCDSAPKSVLTDLGVGCTPPAAVAWINDCGPLVSTPKTLVLACADANYELAGLHWHAWGKASASATGSAKANDCTPNCAAGHFHSYRMTATVGGLRTCGRAHIYTRLTIVYAGARPAGIAKRDVHTLGC